MDIETELILYLKWVPKTGDRGAHVQARFALKTGANIEQPEWFDPKRVKLTECVDIGFSIYLTEGREDRAWWHRPLYYPKFSYVEPDDLRRASRVLNRISKGLADYAEKREEIDTDNVWQFLGAFAYVSGIKYIAFERVEGTYDSTDGPVGYLTGGYEFRDWIVQLHHKYDPAYLAAVEAAQEAAAEAERQRYAEAEAALEKLGL